MWTGMYAMTTMLVSLIFLLMMPMPLVLRDRLSMYLFKLRNLFFVIAVISGGLGLNAYNEFTHKHNKDTVHQGQDLFMELFLMNRAQRNFYIAGAGLVFAL
jgi:positive regulator of sigma E activity